jgi:AraC-like DNA-binding protein
MFVYTYQNKNSAYTGDLPKLIKVFNSHDDNRWHYPYHLHKGLLEVVYIEKGIAHYKIDMNTETAKEGELVIINPETLHTVSVDHITPTSIWVLHANDFSFPNLNHNCLSTYNYRIMALGQHAAFVESAFKEMTLLYEMPSNEYLDVCQYLLTSLLTLFYNLQLDAANVIPDACPDFAKEIMLYLNENYKKPLTLQNIADHFYLSRSRLSHIFTNYFSISPINYLIDRKVCEAKWMLVSSNLSVEQIAATLGYNNVNHFKNIFTKRAGYTPENFRELFSEQEDSDLYTYIAKNQYRV